MAYATRPMHDADSHIMEPPAWLEGHLADELRARLPVLGSADADSTQGFDVDRIRRDARERRVPRRGRVADPAAQELLRDRLVHRGRPAARARPARLREPARVRHVHELARAAHRTRQRPRRSRSRSRAASTGRCSTWCSVDPRLLPVCVVPLGDMAAAVALDARSDRRRRGRVADRPVLPARPLAEPRRPRAGVGDVRGSGRAGRAARRGRGRAT